MSAKKTVCPICGGQIQGTRQEYINFNSVTVNDDGEIMDWDEYNVGLGGDTEIYCENDCTVDEMIERWKADGN